MTSLSLLAGRTVDVDVGYLYFYKETWWQNIPKYTGMSLTATRFLRQLVDRFETFRRHLMRQLDDTFILSEALKGFLRIQRYWPKH